MVSITCLYGMPTTFVAPTPINLMPGTSAACAVACVPGLMPITSTAPVDLFGVNFRPSEPASVNVTEMPDGFGATLPSANWHVTGRPCALMVSITCLYGMPTTEFAPTAFSTRPALSAAWVSACVPGLTPSTSTAPVSLFGENFRPREPASVKVTEMPSEEPPGEPAPNWHVTGRP